MLKKLPRRTASSDGEEPCDEADDLTTRKSGNEKLKISRSEMERESKKMKAARCLDIFSRMIRKCTRHIYSHGLMVEVRWMRSLAERSKM